MKTWSTMLAVMVALVMSVGIANAAKSDAKPVRGKITKIDGANVTIHPKTGDDVTFATTDSTNVTIKGEKKAVSDLEVGANVRVTLDADGKTATDIAVGGGKKNGGASSAPASQPAETK